MEWLATTDPLTKVGVESHFWDGYNCFFSEASPTAG